jgi:hypothetical protein
MKSLCCILLVCLSLTACVGSPTVSADQLQTEVAVALAQTQAAHSPTPEATATEAVTSTPAPTETPTATNTPAATSTREPTNTPRPTSTRRPTATPSLGTLNSPFPYGLDVPLRRSSRGQTSEWSLQVLEVIRGDEANAIARRANTFNDAPPAGASWMFVKVKVTLVSGAAFTLDHYELAVISGGQIFGGFDFSVCCTDDIGYAELDASIALPGTSVEGWVIRPVILDDAKPLLALNIDDSSPNLDDGLFFSLVE